jgi:hypothetical protein
MPPSADAPDWRTLGAFPSALLGAIGGIAWAAALRGWMVELVGSASSFAWIPTFAQILLPGAIVGLLLGVADYFRRTGGRRGWRWLAIAPIAFTIAPLLSPGALETLVTTGLGGGAVAVTLIGILGGLAVSRRGPLWLRLVLGLLVTALIAGGTLATFDLESFGAIDASDVTPRTVWAATLFASLMIVFVFACSLPHRRVVVRSPYRRAGDLDN